MTDTSHHVITVPFFGHLDEVVVGDGRLAGARRPDEHHRRLVVEVDVQEVRLNGRLSGRDDHVTQLCQ